MRCSNVGTRKGALNNLLNSLVNKKKGFRKSRQEARARDRHLFRRVLDSRMGNVGVHNNSKTNTFGTV
jgi:hypothetical protein